MGRCDPRGPWESCSGSLTSWPHVRASPSGLRELCVCGVRGAAHQGDPVLQTGLSHPAVQGKDGVQRRAGCGRLDYRLMLLSV